MKPIPQSSTEKTTSQRFKISKKLLFYSGLGLLSFLRR
jgi:cytochrome c-type biogenesis protein